MVQAYRLLETPRSQVQERPMDGAALGPPPPRVGPPHRPPRGPATSEPQVPTPARGRRETQPDYPRGPQESSQDLQPPDPPDLGRRPPGAPRPARRRAAPGLRQFSDARRADGGRARPHPGHHHRLGGGAAQRGSLARRRPGNDNRGQADGRAPLRAPEVKEGGAPLRALL
eukprot:8582557-Pyramimonas_sp.AAC.1